MFMFGYECITGKYIESHTSKNSLHFLFNGTCFQYCGMTGSGRKIVRCIDEAITRASSLTYKQKSCALKIIS